ncbi:hypothetical protein K435DRAFT_836527 [Dendrothele bispora CBS 962.96]|uniref:Epidermal growth factor receptor-like transmembrane-juxtamembrane segment domain-containing protein n=1 Tax=Dendrothele bispora (strain CBS 962.96) TaxID=1314807 RepID=A0A4S8MHK0_DENBC|nr:hypothetical protein K435DRAFT_836527 [Dendrothele bispora CBS 962.96]
MSNAVTIVLDDSIFLFDSNDDCDFAGGDGIFTTFNATIMRAKANCRFWYQKMEPGTTIEFYGFTPPQNTDQTFLVTANGSSDLAFPGTYPEPSIGDLFYTSTVTDEELATWEINMHTNGPLLIFDYAVVAVAEYEELQGKTIIVDDSNTEIQWEPEGNWEERRNYTLYGRAETIWVNDTDLHPATRPHGNGTHESDKVGDSLIFQFQGTSILVAGIAPLNRTVESLTDRPIFNPPLGYFNLGLNFTLDGYSQLVTFTNEDLSLPGGSPHFPYFRNDSLSEGNHTLIMTVVDVTGNTSVIIDYLTYNPSFATVRDKPTFSISNSTSAPSPPETQSPDPTPGPESDRGAIAGGVVGGVVFLVLLALGVWLVYRKKQQARRLYQRESQTMNAPTSNLTIAPFVLLDPTEPLPSKGYPIIFRNTLDIRKTARTNRTRTFLPPNLAYSNKYS